MRKVSYNRRDFLKHAFGAACLLAASPAHGLAKASDRHSRPNIIIIMVDDIGYQHPSYMGNLYYETPNIDRLADEGLVFTNGYSANTVCAPARAAVRTGQYPAALGIKRLSVSDYDAVFLPGPLKQNGYVTCHIGKWHGTSKKYTPADCGYDYDYLSSKSGHQKSLEWPYTKSGKIEEKLDFPELTANGRRGDILTDQLGEKAVEFIRTHKDEPFLLELDFYAVHVPVATTPEYEQYFKNKIKQLGGEIPVVNQPRVIKGSTEYNYLYAGAMKKMDDNVGAILDTLDKEGLSDDTLVVFLGDNGAKTNVSTNKPLRAGKNAPYEGGIRIPWVMRYKPLIKPGGRTECPAVFVDLFPTIMELSGSAVEPEYQRKLDGISLVEVMKEPSRNIKRCLFWLRYPRTVQYYSMGPSEYCLPFEAVREGDWKLIHFRPCYLVKERYELYNIKEDIGERNDLASAMPEKVKKLAEKLRLWQASTKVQKYDPAEYSFEAMAKAHEKRKARSREKLRKAKELQKDASD